MLRYFTNNQNPLSIDNGVRPYSASAYCNAEVAKRPNLTIITSALAEKIDHPQTTTGRIGPSFHDRRSYCRRQQEDEDHPGIKTGYSPCGAIKSPQLLELSGIDARDLLTKHGLEVMIENAHVGENLQGHVLFSISLEVADDQVSGDVMDVMKDLRYFRVCDETVPKDPNWVS